MSSMKEIVLFDDSMLGSPFKIDREDPDAITAEALIEMYPDQPVIYINIVSEELERDYPEITETPFWAWTGDFTLAQDLMVACLQNKIPGTPFTARLECEATHTNQTHTPYTMTAHVAVGYKPVVRYFRDGVEK